MTSASSFQGTSQLSITNGIGTFSIYFESAGSKSLQISSGSISTDLSIEVQACRLVITSFTAVIFNQPSNSEMTFSLTVSVFDQAASMIEQTRGVHSISLKLVPDGQIVGNVQGVTSAGVITFTGLRVTSAGMFSVLAERTGFLSDSTAQFNVVNFPFQLQTVSDSNRVSCFFEFYFQVVVFAEDGRRFLSSVNVYIDQIASMTSTSGSYNVVTNDGSADFTVLFSTSGTKTLTSRVNSILISLQLEVTNLKLKFETQPLSVPSNQALQSTDIFSISISIYDDTLSTIESQRSQFEVSLSLSNNGVFFGTTTSYTSSGQATFTGLRILSGGSFIITVFSSSSEVTSAQTSSISVQNFVYSISHSSPSTVSVNFEFTLTVFVKGEDGLPFNDFANIVVTGVSGLEGMVSQETSVGSADFLLYFTRSGNFEFWISCYGKSQQVSVVALKNSLRIVSVVPSVIFK
jgi:hypothetical protein